MSEDRSNVLLSWVLFDVVDLTIRCQRPILQESIIFWRVVKFHLHAIVFTSEMKEWFCVIECSHFNDLVALIDAVVAAVEVCVPSLTDLCRASQGVTAWRCQNKIISHVYFCEDRHVAFDVRTSHAGRHRCHVSMSTCTNVLSVPSQLRCGTCTCTNVHVCVPVFCLWAFLFSMNLHGVVFARNTLCYRGMSRVER